MSRKKDRAGFRRQPVFAWCLCVLWLSLQGCYSVDNADWDSVKRMVRVRYPDVAHISTSDLYGWLSDTNRPAPLLIDTRELAEFRVSHLHGAIRAATPAEAFAATDTLPIDSPIITYCSVGFRSAKIAGWLESRGFRNVQNLEGSIFEWANSGYPLYRGDEKTMRVHPYDRQWGKLLNHKLWAWEPGPVP